MKNDLHIKNKRAYFEYEILDKYTAGIKLLGTEIKSVREGKVSLNEGYCIFISGILYIRNLHIAEYSHGSFYNHEAKRDRVLLLNRKEVKKLASQMNEKGLTLIPLYLFINDRGFAKLEIALAHGKKLYDKRESIKARDTSRELQRKL